MTTGEYAACQVSRPSIWKRLWRRLGFGRRWDEALFEWRNQDPPEPPFAPGAFSTHIVVHLSWPDRFRLLVSGRCEIMAYTKTDVMVNTACTRSEFAVLPPGGG